MGATDTIDFISGTEGTSFSPTLDYRDPNLIVLTDPLGWGGDRIQAGYYNDRIVEDELFQYRLGVGKELGGFFSKINFGLAYTDRSKNLTPDEFFVSPANGATEVAIPNLSLIHI